LGLSDKFKDLTKQAKEAVAEHREQLQDAVEAAGVAADQKTRGKHTAKIAKFGQKATDAIDKFAVDGEQEPGGEAQAGAQSQAGAQAQSGAHAPDSEAQAGG
jgi:antitoxin protein of toxin-antitoxin system